MTKTPEQQREAEQQAAIYLEAGRQLTMTHAGLSEDDAFKVFVVWLLSVIKPCIGGTDADLAAWLRAEADAIELNGAKPGGTS